MNERQLLEIFRQKRNELLPSGPEIYTAAIDKELSDNCGNPAWIKSHFSQLVESTQITAYEIYKKEERSCVSQIMKEVFGKLLPPKAEVDDLFNSFEDNFWALDQFFLSLSQGRRARAGKAFENIIKVLFKILEYPCESQPIINGKPDFLLPSKIHFQKNAMDCIIFTVKRTLRERWRQIVTEGMRGYLFFLATIDEKISPTQLKEIRSHRIYVVVPERIRIKSYPKSQNVISFETFFEQHLDPAMSRWHSNKVI